MSFLYRSTPLVRLAARPAPRLFSTTAIQQKVIPDAVKEPLKKVDRTVSDQLVKGIDASVAAKDKAAAAAGVNASEAQGKAEQLTGEAKGKAAELSGEAKGKAEELKGEAKAKMS